MNTTKRVYVAKAIVFELSPGVEAVARPYAPCNLPADVADEALADGRAMLLDDDDEPVESTPAEEPVASDHAATTEPQPTHEFSIPELANPEE
jgi:hypothetical protein